MRLQWPRYAKYFARNITKKEDISEKKIVFNLKNVYRFLFFQLRNLLNTTISDEKNFIMNWDSMDEMGLVYGFTFGRFVDGNFRILVSERETFERFRYDDTYR